jgi:hypothetical protein
VTEFKRVDMNSTSPKIMINSGAKILEIIRQAERDERLGKSERELSSSHGVFSREAVEL